MPKKLRIPRVLPPELRTREIADIRVMRLIVNMIGGWQECDRACRRKKACASRKVECFDSNREAIRDILARFADWPRLDGPRDADEFAQPVEDILD